MHRNPPADAAVFCFDEKTRMRTPDRTRPTGPGRGGTTIHEHRRSAALEPFAVLSVGSRAVLHDARRSQAGRDVPAFFRWVDMRVDPGMEVHVILDDLSAHEG
ncbi:hypothetical protein ACH9D2_10925 [Kocuria sp. M4R2S49]